MLNCAVIFGNRRQYEHNWGLQAKGRVGGDGTRGWEGRPGRNLECGWDISANYIGAKILY